MFTDCLLGLKQQQEYSRKTQVKNILNSFITPVGCTVAPHCWDSPASVWFTQRGISLSPWWPSHPKKGKKKAQTMCAGEWWCSKFTETINLWATAEPQESERDRVCEKKKQALNLRVSLCRCHMEVVISYIRGVRRVHLVADVSWQRNMEGRARWGWGRGKNERDPLPRKWTWNQIISSCKETWVVFRLWPFNGSSSETGRC